tara:strand:- start:354 stop:698 length:345 start_codon:yes stop_codon:yes gene_type:complete
MMAKKTSALAGIFDDEPEAPAPAPAPTPVADATPAPQPAAPRRSRRAADTPAPAAPARRSSHPGKKPVLIHIPEDMHRTLRQLSVEEGGEPLTVITERLLRQYLVQRGHTRFAP